MIERKDLDETVSLGSHPRNSVGAVVAKEAVKILRTMADQCGFKVKKVYFD